MKKYVIHFLAMLGFMASTGLIEAAANGRKRLKIALLKENLPQGFNQNLEFQYYLINIPNAELSSAMSTQGGLQNVLFSKYDSMSIVTPDVKKWATSFGRILVTLNLDKYTYLPSTNYPGTGDSSGIVIPGKAGYTPFLLIRRVKSHANYGPWSTFPIAHAGTLLLELQGAESDTIRGGWSND